MAEAARYQARFSSTDDPDRDLETTRLEDNSLTLDEIKAACRRYRVRARYEDEQGTICELDPSGERIEPTVRRH
jgi:hypothetical protein